MKNTSKPGEPGVPKSDAMRRRRFRIAVLSVIAIAFCVWLVLEWERTRLYVFGGEASPWYYRVTTLFRPAPPYPVVDSGNEAANVFWIDSDRVIFSGASSDSIEQAKRGGEPFPAPRTLVWNTRTGETQDYSEGGVTCFADGRVHVGIRRGELRFEQIGKLGEETERRQLTAVELREAAEREGRKPGNLPLLNPFDCSYCDAPDPLPQLPGKKMRLKKGHGVLYLAPDEPQTNRMPVTYFPDGQSKGIELPVERWQVSPTDITYSIYGNAYLMYSPAIRPGLEADWPQGQPRPIFLLKPDGAVETVHVPYGEWIRRGGQYFGLTAKGLIWGQQRPTGASPLVGTGGAYLLDDARVVKLLEGLLLAEAVSPDGCKVAMSFSADQPKWRNRLVMINVCERGKE